MSEILYPVTVICPLYIILVYTYQNSSAKFHVYKYNISSILTVPYSAYTHYKP